MLSTLLLSAYPFSATAQDETFFDIDLPVSSEGLISYQYTHRAMGTEFEFTLIADHPDALYDEIKLIADEAFAAIDSLEREISSWIPTSNTSEINRYAFDRSVRARRNVYELLKLSKRLHHETNGAFDITVGALIDLWRESLDSVPSETDIKRVIGQVGMKKIDLDNETHEVSFSARNMRISFGGIGKGLALDRAGDIVKKYGINNALLSGGKSSILALGSPPGKNFWQIGVHNPYNSDMRVATVYLRDQALSTSACYNSHLGESRDTPCGIFDPRTGQTVNNMMSVTVIAPSGMETDALSTSFFVMGTQGVREYCKIHTSVKAIVVEQPKSDVHPSPIRIGTWKTK